MQKPESLSYSVFIDNKASTYEKKTVAEQDKLKPNQEKKIIGILPRRTCVWVDDDSVDECYKCHSAFSWYNRRHHCRGCGRVFCYGCSTHNIYASETNKSGLIDPEKYLIDCLRKVKGMASYRACEECMQIYKKIKELSSLVLIFELLPLEITEYYNLRKVNRMWYETCNLSLSRFREIQYNLPNHPFTAFEHRVLKNNLHLILGHNKLICQFIKSLQWDSLGETDKDYYINLIDSPIQTCNCWSLMCCRECQKTLGDSEVIDILLHVREPKVRENVIKYLTANINLLECYVPILTYCIRLDEETHKKSLDVYTIRDHLILLSLKHQSIRYKFFWELIVQLEEPQFNPTYRKTLELLFDKIEKELGESIVNDMKNGMRLINTFSKLSVNVKGIDQFLVNKLIDNKIYEKEIPLPIRPELIMGGIDFKGVRIMDSATSPVYIPCSIKNTKQLYSVIYKSQDIRIDHIVMSLIRIMDHILKANNLDMNIVTYNILPTAMNSGLIEIVPASETLYTIKERNHSSVQNYILENNVKCTIEVVRDRFIRSTAAYCVITYLLGIGDRHLENIMVTQDGRLFHIDYSFALGLDPKPLAPKMRITEEMIDALGGAKSTNYKMFEEYCSQCYNVLRRHANLFSNILLLLTKIGQSKFTMEQLEVEIGKRFLPGEYRSQAKVQLIKTINNSKAASTFVDFIHYQYKERLAWSKSGTWDLYDQASTWLSYYNPFSNQSAKK